MEAAVLTTIISAVVSLVVTLITVFVSKSTIKAEREKLERELQRSMTAKLYDVRLDSYPRAMEITEGLRISRTTGKGKKITQTYFQDILDELDTWHATKAAFIMSRNSLNELYSLREVLRQKPEASGKYTEEQLKRVWDAKGKFREALWSDMHLLFNEDQTKK